jgi:hypothetical protein
LRDPHERYHQVMYLDHDKDLRAFITHFRTKKIFRW